MSSGVWWDSWVQPEQQRQAAAVIPSKQEFLSRVQPWMLDESGAFKGPDAGVNYMLQGLKAGDVWDQANILANSNSEFESQRTIDRSVASQLLDPSWRDGPDNGGGFLGGITRAIKGMVRGVGQIAPLRMAANAVTGGAAELAFGASAIDDGGNLGDIAKSMAMSYVGGKLGNMANSAAGGGTVGSMVGGATKSLVGGGNPLLGALTGAAGNLVDSTDMSADAKKFMTSFTGSALRQLSNNTHSVNRGQFQSDAPIEDAIVSDERAKSSAAALEELLAQINKPVPPGSIAGRFGGYGFA